MHENYGVTNTVLLRRRAIIDVINLGNDIEKNIT